MHMYFKSACENLNYALNASGENQKEYLRQARNRFIDATTIEKNENLILSYIGLALCQVLTDDNENSTKTISKIKNVVISLPDDIDELGSMMRYCKEWLLFSGMYFSRRILNFLEESKENSFDRTFNFWFEHYSGESKLNLKQYFKRLLKAYNICGINYVSALADKEKTKHAIKKILQEDFEAFKSDILLQFEIN